MDEKMIFGVIGDCVPFGLIVTDALNHVLYVNPAAKVLAGINANGKYSLPESMIDNLISFTNDKTSLNILGRIILIQRQKSVLFDKLINVYFLMDETEKNKTEEELYLYKTILDTMPDYAAIVCDKDANIIFYSKLSSMHDGIPQSYVLGRNLKDFVADYKNDPLAKVLKSGEAMLNYRGSYSLYTGKEIHRVGRAYPIKKNGETVGVYSLVRHQKDLNVNLAEAYELQRHVTASNKKNYNGTRYTFDDIIGESATIKEAIEKAKKAAFSTASVLIYGETGTGKELFAQSIHNAGIYADKPFAAINCAAIPESLMESTLFGTTKGAFTGSDNTPGVFEQVKDGTIFLDEINSMPLQLQSKLLRTLQEKTVRRLGGKGEISVNCRVISSCNKLPLECLKNRTIRDDIYYRISAISINVPPLRDRKGDILHIADFYIQKYMNISNEKAVKMTDEVKEAFQRYTWPGNIRELQHVIESLSIMAEPQGDISLQQLPSHIAMAYYKNTKQKYIIDKQSGGLRELLLDIEQESILKALENNNWNITHTAKEIGYTRSNLQYRMSKLGIADRNK